MEINFKKLSILFLTFSIMGLICLGAVSAHNVSVGDCSTDKKVSGVVLSSDLSVRDVSNSSIDASGENLNNVVDDYYSSNASSFKELQNDLNTYSKVKLTRNVTLKDEEYRSFKEGMIINNDKWIDGNGYTIDACKKTRIFKANKCNLYLNNLNLINGTYYKKTVDENFLNKNKGGAVWADGFVSCTNCYFEGNVAHNGGVICGDGGVECSNCSFIGNFAWYGGAIFSDDGGVTVTNCSFINNTADGDGGAIRADEEVVCSNCSFIGNCAWNGGAVFSDDGSVTVTNCSFISNTADKCGGAIWADEGVECFNCSFSGNKANGDGGAVFSDDSSVTVTGCKFICNVAGGDGGAINGDNGVTAINCEFSGNRASCGGGIYADDYGSEVAISGCEFSGNYAGKKGHNAYTDGHFTKLESNTFYNHDFSNCFVEGHFIGSDDEYEGDNNKFIEIKSPKIS